MDGFLSWTQWRIMIWDTNECGPCPMVMCEWLPTLSTDDMCRPWKETWKWRTNRKKKSRNSRNSLWQMEVSRLRCSKFILFGWLSVCLHTYGMLFTVFCCPWHNEWHWDHLKRILTDKHLLLLYLCEWVWDNTRKNTCCLYDQQTHPVVPQRYKFNSLCRFLSEHK